MKYLFFVSHGELAAGLQSATQMMTGPREEVFNISLPEGMSTLEYADNFRKLLEPIDFSQDELIILTDIMGGSPFSLAVEILSEMDVLDKCTIIGGANLALAVTAVIQKDILEKEEFVKEVIKEGQTAVSEFRVDAVDDYNEI